jgi:hypothetical protein
MRGKIIFVQKLHQGGFSAPRCPDQGPRRPAIRWKDDVESLGREVFFWGLFFRHTYIMDTGIFKGLKLVGMKGSKPSVTAPKRDDPVPLTRKDMDKPPKVVIVGEVVAAPKKKGRPNLKEAKKQGRAHMSALDLFIENKPTKAKVREYLEARIHQLKEEEG